MRLTRNASTHDDFEFASLATTEKTAGWSLSKSSALAAPGRLEQPLRASAAPCVQLHKRYGFCKDRRDRCRDRCRDRPNRVGFCRDCRDRKLRCLKITLLITVPTVLTKTHTVWTVPTTVPTTVLTVLRKTHTVLAFASGERSNVF
jgi:hypothetical protein